MKKRFSGVKILTLSLIAVLTVWSACKKNDNPNPNPANNTSKADEDSLKYFVYNYMQRSFVDGGRDTSFELPTYYWYNQVPVLDPFSSEYDSAEVLLNKMRSYPVLNGKQVDHYSFLDKAGAVSEELQQGIAGDFGMEVTYASSSDGKSFLFVLYTDKNSPAGKKGITRGWEITAINGSTDIGYDGGNGPHVNAMIKAVYGSDESTFTFLRPDGTTVDYTLSKATYDINPVLFDTVYPVDGKKVGYFVFNTFSSVYNYDDNGKLVITNTKTEIDKVFTKFQSAGINDLIVDLRYNGGGAVVTAEYLDSLIAPSSVTGKVMYSYLYNDKLSGVAGDIGLTDKITFNGGGNLNLDHVFFIVTGGTASASELTMNNLKPYRDVKLIGETTYGKPVGFFTFTITDFDKSGKEQYLADLYAINFETRNANNEGGYFNGISPDVEATDFVNIPWGDTSDNNLSQAITYIKTGSFNRVSASARMRSNPDLRVALPSTIKSLRFNGMVDYQKSRELQKKLMPLLRKK